MVSANEKMNILGIVITGLSLLPMIPQIAPANPIHRFLITGLLAFIGATLLMNKGDKYIVNLLAQKEPLAVSIGLGILSAVTRVVLTTQTVRNSRVVYITVATVLAMSMISLGLISRYSKFLDF